MGDHSLSVLHLASFAGNTGDLLNHIGFKRWFERQISRDVSWNNLEIRDYYRHKWKFDDQFFDLVNSHDLLVIGGGNYFELWPENSRSGTSIDLVVEDFSKITTPVFFNSLGVDNGQGISKKSRQEFPRLIKFLTSHNKYFVSIRNDGALDALKQICDESVYTSIVDLPDGGFFVLDQLSDSDSDSALIVGVNLAGDMSEIRFANGDRRSFLREFALGLASLKDQYPDIKFRGFAHVYSDYGLLSELLDYLPDEIRRESFEIVGLSHDDSHASEVIRLYGECSLVLGMRFHSNVVPFGLGIPTIGISTYPQITHLYGDLGIPKWIIDGWDVLNLANQISTISKMILEDYDYSLLKVRNALDQIVQRRARASTYLRSWLVVNSLLD